MNQIPPLLVQIGVGLLNVIMALITLAVIIRFWLKQRRAGMSSGWRILLFAFAAFAIAQALEFRRLLFEAGPTELATLVATTRFVSLCIFIIGLSRVLDDFIVAKQILLDESQKTIRLQAETVRQNQEAQLLHKISQSLTNTLDLETVLQELCCATRELLGADNVSVRLPKPMADGFRFAEDNNPTWAHIDALDPQVDALCWKVVETGAPTVIDEVPTHPMFGPQTPRWLKSLSAFPLRRGPFVIGVLTALYTTRHIHTPSEQNAIATLADQAAIGVYNAELMERAKRLAHTDGLTGLANRRRFDESLAAESRRARRYKAPASLILFDLNKFKQLNDEYGHLAGDACLQAFARLLQQHSRDTDIPARYGGDEFAIIMPNTPPAAARQMAARLREAVRGFSIQWDDKEIPIRASLGLAGWEAGEVMSPQELVDAADKTLYVEKTVS